jgi:hypothetical protein
MKKLQLFLILLLLYAAPAFATHTCTTCFIDPVNGADTNSGATALLPWKHITGSPLATNNASTQVPAPGDSYYFMGNEVVPNSNLPIVWSGSWSGNASTTTNGCTGTGCIYIGSLSTFFAPITGTVNTSGTAVTWVTGVHKPGMGCTIGCSDFGDFNTTWIGQTITIGAGNCTVASITDAQHMACTATQGTQTGAAFSANIWGRPIFDAGNAVVPPYLGWTNVFVVLRGNYVHIDNIEMRGLYWTGPSNPFGQSVMMQFCAGSANCGAHDEASNLFLHGWSHGPNNNTLGAANTIGGDCGIIGDSSVPNNNTNTSSHDNIVTGADTARDSCDGGFGGPPIWYRNWIEYTQNGGILNGITSYHDNMVTNVVTSYQQYNTSNVFSPAHTNGLELNAQSTDVLVYNNVFRHLGTGTLTFWCATNAGVNCYGFNNVFYDTDVNNILDPAQSVTNNGCAHGATYCNVAGNFFYFNNTIECGQDANPNAICQGSNAAITAITHQNNHYITSGSLNAAPPTPTLTTNILQNKATANGQGYNSGQTYAFYPTTGGSTIGAGTSLTSLCTTINALNAAAGTACLLDTTYGVSIDRTTWTVTGPARTAVARKATPDASAYEFTAGASPADSFAPTSLAFGNQVQGTSSAPQTIVLTNVGTGTLTISSIVASSDYSDTSTCGGTLGASLSCNIVVTFSPTILGADNGTITVTDNAIGSPHVLNLTGTGISVGGGPQVVTPPIGLSVH